jgi:small-conductance mechanosensitive channel
LIVRYIVLHYFKRLAKRTSNTWDDLAIELTHKTKIYVLLALSIYAGLLVLHFSLQTQVWINAIVIIIALIQVAIWGNTAINYGLLRYQRNNQEDAEDITTLRALGLVARITLFSVLGLVALDNIPGVEITALIASLGIGGIAVALAINNILGDLFSSISIALDKPFVIGDYIVVGSFSGNVENIGLKTTRVRSSQGEELIFSNSDLLSSRIQNFKTITERRNIITIGVTYETAPHKLKHIPEILREVIEAQEQVRFDRAHFKQFNDSSLDFEAVYYVLDSAYAVFMDIQQAINFELFRRFAADGIEFAYPTQTIHLANGNNSLSKASTSPQVAPD